MGADMRGSADPRIHYVYRLLVLRNNRERLGDEAAAESVASAIEAATT